MKKFILIIVIVILVIVFLKNVITTKYSHSDILALINKGIENMDNMSNISFEKENKGETVKYYFKGDKWKMVSPDAKLVNITLEDGKTYGIDNTKKNMFVNSSKILTGRRGLQDDALRMVKNDVRYENQFRCEFTYIRDEKIDNKDCIFVKVRVHYIETNKYIDYNYASENKIPVYWIEKSTGFVIRRCFNGIRKKYCYTTNYYKKY